MSKEFKELCLQADRRALAQARSLAESSTDLPEMKEHWEAVAKILEKNIQEKEAELSA